MVFLGLHSALRWLQSFSVYVIVEASHAWANRLEKNDLSLRVVDRYQRPAKTSGENLLYAVAESSVKCGMMSQDMWIVLSEFTFLLLFRTRLYFFGLLEFDCECH